MLDGDTSKRHLLAVGAIRRFALAIVVGAVLCALLLLMVAAGRAVVRTSEQLHGAAFCACPAAALRG